MRSNAWQSKQDSSFGNKVERNLEVKRFQIFGLGIFKHGSKAVLVLQLQAVWAWMYMQPTAGRNAKHQSKLSLVA